MSEGLLNGLLIIPVLAVLILVHEIGHFVAARSVGVTVEEFGIGIPPRLKGWRRNGVLWSINWIPFGGFVRVKGEDANDTDPGSMNAKGPLQRAFFLVAGSTMNFLLAIVLMIVILGILGVPRQSFYIGEVLPNSPAAAAGWQVNDRIVSVAGTAVERDRDLKSRSKEFAGQEMSVVVRRGDELVDTLVVPRENPGDQGALGIRFFPFGQGETSVTSVAPGSPAAAAGLSPGDEVVAAEGEPVPDQFALGLTLEQNAGGALPLTVVGTEGERTVDLAVPELAAEQSPFEALGLAIETDPIYDRVPAGEIIPLGLEEAWARAKATVDGISQLISGEESLGQVAGPVGMGQLVSEVVSLNPQPVWVTLAELTVLLSLNLGILNLLPLPALDGGRLLFVLVEVLRGGRRVAPEREGLVHMVGFVLLIGLMLVITFADVGRLFSGESFLQP